MLAIKPAGLSSADKELGAIGVRASVGHGEGADINVLQGEVLILEFVAIDRLATSTISCSEVTTLAHEARDDSVEGGALEAEALLSSAQSTEVLSCAGHNIFSELEDNTASGVATDGDVEKDLLRHDELEVVELVSDAYDCW